MSTRRKVISCLLMFCSFALGSFVVAILPAAEDVKGEVEHVDTGQADAGAVHAGDAAHEDTDVADHAAAAHNPYDRSHANSDENLESFTEIKRDLALWTLVVFLLLLAILWKFAWGPISEALVQREQRIADDMAAARAQNEQAKELLHEHEIKLASAADEVRKMLDQARREADAQKQSIIDEAQQAAASEKDRAVREIGAAKNEALRDLADKSVGTAVDLAGRIVGRQLNQSDHENLIKDALDKFSGSN